MSFAVIIKKGNDDDIYLPLASESFYYTFLFPKIVELDLKYLLDARLGIDFSQKEIDAVISEFSILQKFLEKKEFQMSDQQKNSLFAIERISRIIKVLNNEKSKHNIEGYIG